MSHRRTITGRDPGRSSPEALADEREFLLQSIDDLQAERAAGEVDEEDFTVLAARYGERLAEVEAAQAGGAPPGALGSGDGRDGSAPTRANGARGVTAKTDRVAAPGRRLRRQLGKRRVRLLVGLAAAGCFVVAAGLLAASVAGVRLPGESVTGSVTLSTAQQEQETLERAAVLGSEGQAAEAVQLYDQVLKTDPDQPDALTYGGWLVRLAGISGKNRTVLAAGDASVARAVKVAPSYPDAHALFGVILYEDFARPAAAAVQFRDALSAQASANLLASVAAVAGKCFAAAHEPLPPRYAAALKSLGAGTGAG